MAYTYKIFETIKYLEFIATVFCSMKHKCGFGFGASAGAASYVFKKLLFIFPIYR